ncbi:MAG: carboxylesterase [Acidobacteriota bacterium]
MADAPLDCVEVGPPDADAAVIWLHGLGADGWDFQPIVPELGLPPDLRVRFVFPHAPRRPVTINMGLVMRAWYDIAELSLDERGQDVAGIEDSARRISALVERERQRGITPARLVLAGFSQGGAMALHVGLRHPERLAGLVALSCYLLLPARTERERSEASRGLPVFQAHGEHDDVVPLVAGEMTRDALVALGCEVTWRTYPVPHAVHPREIRDIGAFLAGRLAGVSG